MKHIVLTGGGTAGHVTPNIALIPTLKAAGYQISYIGSYEGIERKLIEEMGIPYYGISSGKLRRYFDPKNFSDPFRVLKGFHEAKKLLKKLKPDVVFSKGGFVTVPVVIAAKKCKIPAIIHESDMTPGLANKLCIPSAVKVCCNFPETVSSLPANKAVLTGTPIRQELLKGDKEAGRQFCGFTTDKPVLMVIGGSLGAASVNDHVRKILPELLKEFQVHPSLRQGQNGRVPQGYRRVCTVRIHQGRASGSLRTVRCRDFPCRRQCNLRDQCPSQTKPSDSALCKCEPR